MTSHNELWGERTRNCPTQEVRERSGVFILKECLADVVESTRRHISSRIDIYFQRHLVAISLPKETVLITVVVDLQPPLVANANKQSLC